MTDLIHFRLTAFLLLQACDHMIILVVDQAQAIFCPPLCSSGSGTALKPSIVRGSFDFCESHQVLSHHCSRSSSKIYSVQLRVVNDTSLVRVLHNWSQTLLNQSNIKPAFNHSSKRDYNLAVCTHLHIKPFIFCWWWFAKIISEWPGSPLPSNK